MLMTVFTAQAHTEDGRRWLRITDERSGDTWDEPARDWTEIHAIMAHQAASLGRHYRHNRDGRIALPEDRAPIQANFSPAFPVELTAAGEQTVIPGCERNASPKARQLDLFG